MEGQKAERTWNKIQIIIMITAFLCFIGIIAVSIWKGTAYHLTYMDGNRAVLEEGWTLVSEGTEKELKLPQDYTCASEDQIILERKLDQQEGVGNILKLQFLHLKTAVYLDDTLIYEANQGNLPFSHTPARTLHFILLPQDYAGKQLRLVLTPALEGTEVYRISAPVLGDTLSLLSDMLHHEALALAGAVILLFIGIIIIIFSFFVHRLNFAGQIFYLGMFSLIAGVFCFCETELAVVLCRNSYLVHIGDAVALQLICLPFFSLLSITCRSYSPKMVRLGAAYTVGNFVIQNILNFSGRDYRYFVVATHLGILYCIFVIAAILIKAVKRKDRHTIYYMFTFLPIGLSAIFELLPFYLADFPMQGFFFEMGVFLFILLQIGEISIQVVRNYQQAAKSQMFQAMAFTDNMTKLENRAAYQQRIDTLSSSLDGRKICCAIMDVNHLKMVNDTMGHYKGDDLIMEAADALKKVFGSLGKVYRIGGDEFAAIIEDISEKEMEKLRNEFKDEIHERDLKNTFPVQAAFGYAFYEPEQDENLEHTFARADNFMYEDKKRDKARN